MVPNLIIISESGGGAAAFSKIFTSLGLFPSFSFPYAWDCVSIKVLGLDKLSRLISFGVP